MFTNGEIRRAIEKYQKEHPLHFGQMIDVTAIDSKEGADIISQTVEEISKKVAEDTELWCICEMAKMYMRGVKPVYPVRPQGEWLWLCDSPDPKYKCEWLRLCDSPDPKYKWSCNKCGRGVKEQENFCPNCGVEMKGGAE